MSVPNANNARPGRPLRCLVTGGLGYAGAWISRHIAAAGHELFVLSRGAQKKDLGLPYSLVSADIAALSPEELARLLPKELDAVVHAASHNEAFAPGYARDALLANGLGTRNLLRAITLQRDIHKTGLPLVIYPSTFHVYGRSEGEISEDSPALPRNDYALTHLFAEEYCRLFGRTEGLPHIVLRISNGYGAPKTPDCAKWYLLLNDLCRKAVHEGEVRLLSPPDTLRDFIWLGDLAAVVKALLPRRDLAGRVFNVASGKSVGIGTVASLVAQIASRQAGKKIPLIAPDGGKTAPARLTVSNRAVREATGILFQDRMREEISTLLLLAALDQKM